MAAGRANSRSKGRSLMKRALCILSILIAAPAGAYDSTFPNKPGKKPKAQLVVGAQSGATTKAPEDVVVGAGARGGQSGRGDYGFAGGFGRGGFVGGGPAKPKPPPRAVGYDPNRRIGNKAPSS